MKNLLMVMMAVLVSATYSEYDYGADSTEWPIAHNIGHTGFSASTVIKPPFRIRWKTRVLFPGTQEQDRGPVVAGGKVVIQGPAHQLACLDADNGALLWRTSIPEPVFGNFFQPCIANNRVYAVFSVKGNPTANGIRCFDLNTGELLWKRDAGRISSRFFRDSPQYSKGKVFLNSIRDVNQSTLAENNYRYMAQVQAWDAVTGDTLWTYTLRDSLDPVRANLNYDDQQYRPALCVVGDTAFAAIGDQVNAPGKIVALDLNGNELWSRSIQFWGDLQYTGDMLVTRNGLLPYTLNPRTGETMWTSSAQIAYVFPAIMNNTLWYRGYASTPLAYNLTNGASRSVRCNLYPGDAYTSGCSSVRAVNGHVYSGIGNPVGFYSGGYCGTNDFPKLYVWDEQGNPIWWLSTPDSIYGTEFGQQRIRNVCQSPAFAYDRMYWVSSIDGWLYCFDADDRVVSSLKAICLPETLEQYRWGDVRAVVSYTDGSRDTTNLGCLFSSLDTFQAAVRFEGVAYARLPGTALVQVKRFGLTDTVRIPVIPSKTLTDTPVFIRRINFQNGFLPFKYGWLSDKAMPYTPSQGYGWLNVGCPSGLPESNYGLGSANFLFQSFVSTGATATKQYRIDVPDGDYIIRIGMGYNTWGVSWYDWTTFGNDTIARKPSGTGNAVSTDTIHVSGGTGIVLTVKGAINYIVLCSANQGIDICDVADDDYDCGTTSLAAQDSRAGQPFLSAYPNPFNPGTRIQFRLDKKYALDLVILDIRGTPVRRLASKAFGAGGHVVEWDGRDDTARPLASGVYMVRLFGKGFEKTAKVQLFK